MLDKKLEVKMFRFFMVLFVIIFPSLSYASTLMLRDIDCKILASKEGKVASVDGDRTIGECVIGSNTVTCSYKNLLGKQIGDLQEYEIVIQNKALFFLQSKLGNIKLLIDRQAKYYSYGMVYFSVENTTMLSKNCAGIMTEK